jgi:hypothetical protein
MRLYVPWIVLCAVLFFALRGAEDPSRRHGRILSNDAARIAIGIVHRQPQFRRYAVVHVTDPGRDTKRWLVLCDDVPHTALARAVVVELDARDGSLLTIRKPR